MIFGLDADGNLDGLGTTAQMEKIGVLASVIHATKVQGNCPVRSGGQALSIANTSLPPRMRSEGVLNGMPAAPTTDLNANYAVGGGILRPTDIISSLPSSSSSSSSSFPNPSASQFSTVTSTQSPANPGGGNMMPMMMNNSTAGSAQFSFNAAISSSSPSSLSASSSSSFNKNSPQSPTSSLSFNSSSLTSSSVPVSISTMAFGEKQQQQQQQQQPPNSSSSSFTQSFQNVMMMRQPQQQQQQQRRSPTVSSSPSPRSVGSYGEVDYFSCVSGSEASGGRSRGRSHGPQAAASNSNSNVPLARGTSSSSLSSLFSSGRIGEMELREEGDGTREGGRGEEGEEVPIFFSSTAFSSRLRPFPPPRPQAPQVPRSVLASSSSSVLGSRRVCQVQFDTEDYVEAEDDRDDADEGLLRFGRIAQHRVSLPLPLPPLPPPPHPPMTTTTMMGPSSPITIHMPTPVAKKNEVPIRRERERRDLWDELELKEMSRGRRDPVVWPPPSNSQACSVATVSAASASAAAGF